jgi:flagellar basal-body rod protein FlgB
MLNKIDQEIAFVRTALDLRARRQEMLAANLANADTPNYKARDIDFSAALKAAMGSSSSLSMSRTHAGHLPPTSGDAGAADKHVRYRAAVQPSLDGNTVDTDVERAHFTENAMHYQFLLDRAASTFRTMGRALESQR